MTKREREQRFRELDTRGARELAAMVVECEMHIEKQDREIAKLRRAQAKRAGASPRPVQP